MANIFKFDIQKVIIVVMLAIITFLTIYVIHLDSQINNKIKTVEIVKTEDNKYTQFYYEREFKILKQENKELYDSLKKQKDYITSLERFAYNKKYNTDTVFIQHKQLSDELASLLDSTYEYSSETDSLSYDLNINSKIEPNWYNLTVNVKDEFTIVNKEFADGRQSTSIESANNGELSNITAWQKSNKKKWYQRFATGPSITVGYDPINRNGSLMVGWSVTYNILK